MKEVTVILTSCGRFDLLRITLESFFKHNTYEIDYFFVNDDSGVKIPKEMVDDFPFVDWSNNSNNGIVKNQIASLDYLWSLVTTPYAFQMEDDWKFLKPGFIEASMEVLEQDEKILMIWLAGLEKLNQHPVNWKIGYGVLSNAGNLWSGTRFNPSLRRKADYDLIAPYSNHTVWNAEKPWKCEADISKVYHKLGFKGAILPDTYIKHIGGGRHVG